MKRLPVRPYLVYLFLLAWPATSPQLLADGDELTVHANEVDAQIEAMGPDQRRLYLPLLTFSLVTRFACADDTATATITASIADTHEHYDPEPGERSLTATLQVPRRQIAPITMGEFCVPGSANSDQPVPLPGVTTAQVSLRCQTDTDTTVLYASVPLTVRLVCVNGEDTQEPAPLADAPAAR